MIAARVDDLLHEVPLPDAARQDVLRRLSEPGRHYHGVEHVATLWRRHCHFARGTALDDPPVRRLVAAVIAFHDSVYDPRRRDNEAASAALWREAASDAALEPAAIAWVAATIEATADHLGAPDGGGEPLDRARLWVLDLDLTPLGEDRVTFDRNTALLRLEYAHLSEAEWSRGRLGFLARLLAAPRLYRTPAIAAAFEAPARANIARDIALGA